MRAKDAAEKDEKKSYTFLDAAEKVLKLPNSPKAMHYEAITKVAINKGWIETEGVTPERSMNGRLTTAMTRAESRGEPSRFVRVSDGHYGLAEHVGKGAEPEQGDIEEDYSEHDKLKGYYKRLMEDQLDQHKGRHETYKGFYDEVDAMRTRIKNGQHLSGKDDKSFLRRLLIDYDNGISPTGMSSLNKGSFETFIENNNLVESIERLILEPNVDSYKNFRKAWEGSGRGMNPVRINRVAAACTNTVSIITYEPRFEALFKWFIEEGIVPPYPRGESGDWFSKNQYLMGFLKEALREELERGVADEFYLSQFMWALCKDVLSVKEESEEPLELYTAQSIIQEGCFIEQRRLESMLERLRIKKNLILQGPPGTGKTWLARKLAYALIGSKDSSKVKAVQFHPNLSYEDFVRGWRPSGEGKLTLVDGPFMQMINTAHENREDTYVVVIEEVNRGNPAQVFGEMLTLIEADKREESYALELSYHQKGEKGVFLPENLHIIGTMNIADRSLALVDLAFRRRFAFIDLKPEIGDVWSEWMQDRGIDKAILDKIMKNMAKLNRKIAENLNLGEQFCVGHSYVTLPAETQIDDATKWFRSVVETEIVPLINEYWFDAKDEVDSGRSILLEGF